MSCWLKPRGTPLGRTGAKQPKSLREAIALRPDEPVAYFNLGAALSNSGHRVEAAQRYLDAKERYSVGSEDWAEATAGAFSMLRMEECAEVVKPEWWDDKALKALSARALRTGPNVVMAHAMRAHVLSGLLGDAWEVGPRSAAELEQAATHYDRAAALCSAPAVKAQFADLADHCRASCS